MTRTSKKDNSMYLWIVIAIVAIAAIIAAVVLILNRKGNTGEVGEGNSQPSSSEVVAPNYDTVDETIEFGDFAAMEALSKAIQNGEMTGKTVKINGIVSHPMMNYSIVQQNEDGSEKIGTQFIIDGASDDAYPQDGDHVVITGTIIEKEPLYFVIQTTPKYVELLDVTAPGAETEASSEETTIEVDAVEE